MAKYKLCDCGRKVFFEKTAPMKCPYCTRFLGNIDAMDESEEAPVETVLETLHPDNVPEIWFSLDTTEGARTIAVPEEGCVVGREGCGADWLQEDPEISRAHFAVVYRGSLGLMICDLSRNGTYVNGERLESGRAKFIRKGDRVRIHQTIFEVVRHEREENA